MRILVIITLFILSGETSFGQKLSATLSPEKTEVGGPVKLILKAELDPNSEYQYTPLKLTIPSRIKAENGETFSSVSDQVELIEEFTDSVFISGNKKIWQGTYLITAWDEGTYKLESMSIIIDDSTFTFPEKVLTASLVKANKKIDLYDIKERFAEVPEPKSKIRIFLENYWWVILTVLIVAMLIYYFIKRRNREPEKPIKVPSLKERTLLAVHGLDASKLWEQGKLKEHYIELSFILRSYLSARYDLNLLENTTKAAQLLLSEKGLHEDTIHTIGTVLNQSDLVKFAKEAPDEMEILKISHLVRQIVAETSPFEFEDAE